MRKRIEVRSVYIGLSGSSGTLTIPMPDEARVKGIGFTGGLTIGELAAASGTSYVHFYSGTVISPATGIYATNFLGGVTRSARSNATFAYSIEMQAHIPLDTPVERNGLISIEYLVFANHTIAGWAYVHLEPRV